MKENTIREPGCSLQEMVKETLNLKGDCASLCIPEKQKLS